jgi:Na+-driven multidrug efflux pump
MKSTKDYSVIWQIAWPIILSSLANTVINFTDVAFVARVGEKELAASALGGVFYNRS